MVSVLPARNPERLRRKPEGPVTSRIRDGAMAPQLKCVGGGCLATGTMLGVSPLPAPPLGLQLALLLPLAPPQVRQALLCDLGLPFSQVEGQVLSVYNPGVSAQRGRG